MTEFLTDVGDGKNFRLQNKRIHLTYKSHIPPEAWLSWISKIKSTPIEKYSIVHEKGDSVVPYEHTHILIDFGYSFQTRNSKFFDWKNPNGENMHPNIKIVKTAVHWKRSTIYHYKESIPYTNIPKPETENAIKEIWKHNTLSDALLSTCSTLNNVGGVIAAFNCKPADYGVEPTVEWKPWQKELLDEIEKNPNSRNITWYFDPLGNSGKSFISKHLGQFKGAFVSTKANTYHVATAIDEFLKQNGPNSILVIIFNFTRQQENHKIYQALEELKDGMMTSEKYKGRTMYFPHPHLICMANYIPDITSITKDRWDIRTLQDDIVVKRYLGGKVVFEHPSIDPYIKHSLEVIDETYSKMPDIPQAKAVIPIVENPCRPLNIKGPGEAASPQQPATRELASLEKAASPHIVSSNSLPSLSNLCLPPLPKTTLPPIQSNGRLINGNFYQIPPPLKTPPSFK